VHTRCFAVFRLEDSIRIKSDVVSCRKVADEKREEGEEEDEEGKDETGHGQRISLKELFLFMSDGGQVPCRHRYWIVQDIF
jgi:hypothetical protein